LIRRLRPAYPAEFRLW